MKNRDDSFEETGAVAGLTRLERRRLSSSLEIGESAVERIAYQHTVFCQTCLPYRDPGDIRIGAVALTAVAQNLAAPRSAD